MKKIILIAMIILGINLASNGQNNFILEKSTYDDALVSYTCNKIKIDNHLSISFSKYFRYSFKRCNYKKKCLKDSLILQIDKFSGENSYYLPSKNQYFSISQIKRPDIETNINFHIENINFIESEKYTRCIYIILSNNYKFKLYEWKLLQCNYIERLPYHKLIKKQNLNNLLKHKITDIRLGLKTKYDIHLTKQQGELIRKRLIEAVNLKDL